MLLKAYFGYPFTYLVATKVTIR